MESDKSPPEPPPPAYSGPAPVPPNQQGFPLYSSNTTQYISGSSIPAQSTTTFRGNPVAYGAIPYQNQPAVTSAITWMPAPPILPKCPPGLEYLTQVDRISVQQQIELLELLSGLETCNRYEVKNSVGQWMYLAVEENDAYTLNCHKSLRSFIIKLFDGANQPVMQLSRDCHCSICCFPCICCLQELEVQAPLGTVIGYIKQNWHPCLPRFAIQNEASENVLKIAGPCAPCTCFQDIDFEVSTQDEKPIGRISKQWTGYIREMATTASNFEILFPFDLDVKMKALILGASILLDYMYFEHKRRRSDR
ncbi:phospholipid scramblase 2 [Anolis carolinensis]|uniref:Phospholipid scramblase n=1 Tax=Anolis carolinensis TaxID=28377 RepID=A0A803U114_ANOCA|nr:PREDICTED: phospholipid scramblase 2 [Anolis carolinensis]|eukprot:XP_003227036.2 PREDICTED: phospholipid scramblase 2 [Anolis carolinensis]